MATNANVGIERPAAVDDIMISHVLTYDLLTNINIIFNIALHAVSCRPSLYLLYLGINWGLFTALTDH
ncbi:uncharacterized protein PHACADRAFT_254407 [Phanerochaete carnosa HHB-10118-sp]|uniref:Uncharacterized protein n=1 Tax=Phanerochaete carnosa (strain HHB-10118-sp) TaxID=650164 RepID=K5WD87_PHACS|nr:uncharacterized protein PHACADRAFT_254407 [Phanerochaete carnosa HHB-10118-sp]EKM56974.1 hypothetical protein PHACADRAFT_254407 [Phanerochaete carnosa HHB-10118-sp]